MTSPPDIVVTTRELVALVARAIGASRVAVDIEANGRFAYRATLSTIELAFDDTIAIIDPLAPELAGDLSPLNALLGESGPVKIVHDVGFDARLLTAAGLSLGHVHDTALTATWLGRAATGLASLAASELGVTLDKSLQAQDWAARPLTARSLAYLADDVSHLLPLEARLWGEAEQANITEELMEETVYRLAAGARAVREPDPRPAFTRVKGVEALDEPARAILRRLVRAREAEAERLDSPAGELVPTAVLVALARAKPATAKDLARIRSPIARVEPTVVAAALLEAVAQGVKDGGLSAEDRAWLEPKKLPPEAVRARKERETRLSAWRKAEAAARGVNDQVVLPGHCASEIVDAAPTDLEALGQVGGLGAFRVARYGAAILAAVEGPRAP